MRNRPSLLYTDPTSGGRLYVSGRHFDALVLDELGVNTVLSAVEPPTWLATMPDMTALRCEFADRENVRPDTALARTTTRAVAAAIRAGQGVLVHCQGGVNRSPYLASLVLIELGLTPEEAVKLLLSRHDRWIFTNDSLARAVLGRSIRFGERGWRR
jgi:hypothetical protein